MVMVVQLVVLWVQFFFSLTNIIDLKCCEFEIFFISLQSYCE